MPYLFYLFAQSEYHKTKQTVVLKDLVGSAKALSQPSDRADHRKVVAANQFCFLMWASYGPVMPHERNKHMFLSNSCLDLLGGFLQILDPSDKGKRGVGEREFPPGLGKRATEGVSSLEIHWKPIYPMLDLAPRVLHTVQTPMTFMSNF